MVDIATLGFATDSRALLQAEQALQDVARASAQAEAAAESYGRDSSRAYGRAASAANATSTATKGLTASTKQLAFAQRNLAFQLSDVAQGFALGQAPLQILLQQGFQIAQIFGPGSGGVTAILGQTARSVARFAARLAPAGAALAAFGLVAEGFRRDLNESRREAASFSDVLVATFQVLRDEVLDAIPEDIKEFGRDISDAFDTITNAAITGAGTLLVYGARLLRILEITGKLVTGGLTLQQFLDENSKLWEQAGNAAEDFRKKVAQQLDENLLGRYAEGWAAVTKVSDEAAQALVRAAQAAQAQTRTPSEKLTAELDLLREAQAAGELSAENFGRAQIRATAVAANSYANLASNIGGNLEAVFGESKGLSIATALINTAQAVTTNLAAYPGPLGFAAAAAAAAAGLAQVAQIRSTSKGSNGGVSAPTVSAPAQVAAAEPSRAFNLTLVGDNFSRAQIEELAAGLGDFIGDGGTINTATA